MGPQSLTAIYEALHSNPMTALWAADPPVCNLVQVDLTAPRRGKMIVLRQCTAMLTPTLASTAMTGGKGWACTWWPRGEAMLAAMLEASEKGRAL